MVYIKRNVLLRGADMTMSMDEARLMTLMVAVTRAAGDQPLTAQALADDEILEALSQRFGEAGLYRIVMMMQTQPDQCDTFFAFILSQLRHQSSEVRQATQLACDNASLPQGPEVGAFSTNLLQPSLGRKLYHPGLHPGYLVWGLGGPDMLVSHPFRGVSGGVYGIGPPTKRIAEHLMASGYVGSYLFIDLVPGLDFQVRGQPAWLVWFAIIAAHSDVVVFVREKGAGFTEAQKLEIRFTPDRVQKKIIEIPPGILPVAEPDQFSPDQIIYVTGTADPSKEKFEEMEADHAGPLVRAYAEFDLPPDVLCRRDGDQLIQYPADSPIYQ
jgi:hypothetical protein